MKELQETVPSNDRSHNWKIILPHLTRRDIDFDERSISFVLSGDTTNLLTVLNSLYSEERNGKPWAKVRKAAYEANTLQRLKNTSTLSGSSMHARKNHSHHQQAQKNAPFHQHHHQPSQLRRKNPLQVLARGGGDGAINNAHNRNHNNANHQHQQVRRHQHQHQLYHQQYQIPSPHSNNHHRALSSSVSPIRSQHHVASSNVIERAYPYVSGNANNNNGSSNHQNEQLYQSKESPMKGGKGMGLGTRVGNASHVELPRLPETDLSARHHHQHQQQHSNEVRLLIQYIDSLPSCLPSFSLTCVLTFSSNLNRCHQQ